jgi:HK97 family phage prohead protease
MTRGSRNDPRELRRFTVQNVRERADDSSVIVDLEGYASVTGEPYTVTDYLGEFTEIIDPGAFGKTLSEQADVRFLVNHDGIPLARTSSGTMQLAEDETGLKVDAQLDSRMSLANDLVIAIARGDLKEMSFAFRVIRQTWSPDYEQRNIHEVKLFDVSVVTYPASPATSAKVRASDFILNNLSDDEARDLVIRYSQPKPASMTAANLALRRRQMSLINLR